MDVDINTDQDARDIALAKFEDLPDQNLSDHLPPFANEYNKNLDKEVGFMYDISR